MSEIKPDEMKIYIGLAHSIAYNYYKKTNPHRQDLEDFIEFAYIGVTQAINSWDATKDTKMTTHVTNCIKSAIKTGNRDSGSLKKSNTTGKVYLNDIAYREDLLPVTYEDVLHKDYQDPELLELESLAEVLDQCRDTIDYSIIQGRLGGKTYEAIGIDLGLTKQAVSLRAINIRKRYIDNKIKESNNEI